MTALVIVIVNDLAIETSSSEKVAKAVLRRMAANEYVRNRWHYGTYREYRDTSHWHINEVYNYTWSPSENKIVIA